MFFDDNIGFISLTTDFLDNDKTSVLSSHEGFIKGNMFENEYKGYKNYEVKCPKAKTEREAYLYKIMELDFAINDLNLYLDLHPKDSKIYNDFKKYVEELKKIEKEYEEKYGPLKLMDTTGQSYNWNEYLPWEKEDSKYV